MSTTYFNYKSLIRSLDLSRAISIPKGIGPFTGFARGSIDPDTSSQLSGNTNQTTSVYKITLYPDWEGDTTKKTGTVNGIYHPFTSFLDVLSRDLKTYHQISLSEKLSSTLNSSDNQDSNPSKVNFGLVSKDGFVMVSNDPTLKVNITGATGDRSPKEVVVFARHNYIDEAVDNPITLEAYALSYGNQTNQLNAASDSEYSDINNFYDLYMRAMDIYYNRDVEVDFNKNNPLSSESKLKLSYYDLLRYVRSKCDDYVNNEDQLTLVGIYGTNSENESFSIVPYDGKWPYDLPFNISVMNSIGRSLNDLKVQQSGFPYSAPNQSDESLQNMNIMGYINYQISKLREELVGSLNDASSSLIPPGLICLWDQATPPDGWEEYQGARGRIVIGFNSGGIPTGDNTILSTIGDTYLNPGIASDWSISLTAADIPEHYHPIAMTFISLTDDQNDPTPDNATPGNWNKFDPNLSMANKVVSGDPTPGQNFDAMGITNGAIRTGSHFTQGETVQKDSSNLQSKETISLSKICPAITLMYIRKK